MPIYNLKCPSCEHEFEYLRLKHGVVIVPCPQCGTIAEQQVTAPAYFNFRGSGWTSKKDYYGADKKKQAERERREKC